MPGLVQQQQQDGSSAPSPPPTPQNFQHLRISRLHPTFAAEVSCDFALADASAEQFTEILHAIATYGVLVFRSTNLTDAQHVAFSRRFGALDDIRPYIQGGRKPRYDFYELFDAGNVDADGAVLTADSPRTHYGKGNGFFHVDSSFNPRRAGCSLLKASVLPPQGTGGETEFADTRTAFETLPSSLQEQLKTEELVGVHSLHHSRKRGSPAYFADLNPEDYPMHRHKIAQVHEASGRWNLYMGAHMARIEGGDMGEAERWSLLWGLMGWATRPENVVKVEWRGVGDLVIWDNTAVMHRAAGGSYEHKYARDLRRTTVHDASSTAWGLNEKQDTRPGFNSNGKEQISLS